MLIDNAVIFVKAGDGGNGHVSFHREKYVAKGGPDGGDGGKGGDIVFIADAGMRTLADMRYKKRYQAENGKEGGTSNCTGRSGDDLYIKVPLGTVIKDNDAGVILADLIADGQTAIIAKGGRGGAGNQHFATSTRQVPTFAKAGEEGEERWAQLELKLLADVGLIGFPNVGKSTLLSVISAARPKIADYHFTTLEPNLGVVKVDDQSSFVVADIPGLIEGAHTGAGLGHEFLKHIERTKLMIHVVDVSGSEARDAIQDFEVINSELKTYNAVLAERPQVIAANKTDVPASEENLELLTKHVSQKGYKVFPISAATKKGVKELMFHVAQMLKELPDTILADNSDDLVVYHAKEQDQQFKVYKEADGTYVIEGEWIRKLLRSLNVSSHESVGYFHRILLKKGVIAELEALGVSQGDTVKIYDFEFEYIK